MRLCDQALLARTEAVPLGPLGRSPDVVQEHTVIRGNGSTPRVVGSQGAPVQVVHRITNIYYAGAFSVGIEVLIDTDHGPRESGPSNDIFGEPDSCLLRVFSVVDVLAK